MARLPCPCCGGTATLDQQQEELRKLDAKRQERAEARRAAERAAQSASASHTHSINIGVGNTALSIAGHGVIGTTNILSLSGITAIEHYAIDHTDYLSIAGRETCTDCGTIFNPEARERAQDNADKIEELRAEVLSPLENLALAADPVTGVANV